AGSTPRSGQAPNQVAAGSGQQQRRLARGSWRCYAALQWTRRGLITQEARMAVASLTPRVRTIVICDDVFVSPTEDGVFTLEGVRQHLEAVSFPWRASLNLFLLLSSPRKGAYAGKILVVDEQSDKAIRYVKFLATFEENNELLPLDERMGTVLLNLMAKLD